MDLARKENGMVDLTTRIGKLKLKNPLILGGGPLSGIAGPEAKAGQRAACSDQHEGRAEPSHREESPHLVLLGSILEPAKAASLFYCEQEPRPVGRFLVLIAAARAPHARDAGNHIR